MKDFSSKREETDGSGVLLEHNVAKCSVNIGLETKGPGALAFSP